MVYNVQGAKAVFLVDDAGNSYRDSASTTLGSLVTLAATTNTSVLKTGAGSLFQVDLTNTTGATVYLKFFNKASAPTLGTDVPVLTIPVATASAYLQSFGQYGKRFPVGIAYAVTGLIADSDATAIAAGAKIGFTYL